MERSKFIKSLGLGSMGLILPAGIINVNGAVLSRQVKIYDNYLKGTPYYAYKSCYMDIQVGDKLKLQRVPEHEYDRFAIEVYWQDKKLGYLPAYENIVLANMMDVGVKLESLVTDIPGIYNLSIGILADLIVSSGSTEAPLTRDAADNVDDIYRKGYGLE